MQGGEAVAVVVVQWFLAWPLPPNYLGSNSSSGLDWPDLDQVSIDKPIPGQGNEIHSAAS